MRKKRPVSKGPKKRVGGNHGNGKKFQPGTNSHTGETFRRGPDDIPRGSATLMLKTVAVDKRQDIYDSLCKLVMTPMGALAFTREFADRTEGKPTQKHEVQVPRVTVFEAAEPGAPEAVGPPPPRELAPASIGDGSLRAPNGDVFRAID